MPRTRSVLLAALILLAACTSETDPEGETPDPQEPRGRVVVGMLGEPDTLDPYDRLASDLTYALARPVLPSLYRLGPDGEPVADLAAGLEVNGAKAEVTLRERVWSSGRPITSADVVKSARRARYPSGFAGLKVRATGTNAVTLMGEERDWGQRLARLTFVMPEGRTRTLGVGAGPFVARRYVPGLELSYEPNPRWDESDPLLLGAAVRFADDSAVLQLLLEKGNADVAALPSSVNLGQRLDLAGLQHDSALGWERVVLAFGGDDLTTGERAAVADALSRDLIAEGFLRSEGRASTTLFPGPASQGATGPFAGPLPATQGVGEAVQVAAPGGDELLALVQRVLQKRLEDRGIVAELILAEPRTLYGPWRDESPADLSLLRLAGAPGGCCDRRALSTLAMVPIAQVETFIAWRAGLEGPRANPTFDGPLWNLEDWRLTGS